MGGVGEAGSEEKKEIGLRDLDTLSHGVMHKRLTDLGSRIEV